MFTFRHFDLCTNEYKAGQDASVNAPSSFYANNTVCTSENANAVSSFGGSVCGSAFFAHMFLVTGIAAAVSVFLFFVIFYSIIICNASIIIKIMLTALDVIINKIIYDIIIMIASEYSNRKAKLC